MLYLNRRWNQIAVKLLWWLVMLGILAALPLGYERLITEKSANKVEFVFDYRDLLDISKYKANPQTFMDTQLAAMKDLGIQSMVVYESTLEELSTSRRIQVLSSKAAAALLEKPYLHNENSTYVLFTDQETQKQIQPMIEKAFSSLNMAMQPWTFGEQAGLVIEMPIEAAAITPMDPDPMTMQALINLGFHIVPRLSDARSFVREDIEILLNTLKQQYGISRIVFSGDAVTGFAEQADKNSLVSMADIMKSNDIGLAAIELLRTEQKGLKKLAYLTDYNVVRLHSLYETQAGESKTTISDRFLLAVTDRNIRMIFLNAGASKDITKGIITDPLENLYASLGGPNGAMQRIQDEGYELGIAEPFEAVHSSWQKPLKLITLIGGVSFIVLTLNAFLPGLLHILFLLGMLGSGGLYVLDSKLYVQALALGVGICAPVMAVIMAVGSVRKKQTLFPGGRTSLAFSIVLLLKTSAVSFIGAIYAVGLLNHVTYSLVLEQFRGVSVLHLLPIVMIALYLLLFSEGSTLAGTYRKIRTFLEMNIKVVWVIVVGAAGAAVFYYLSRTGNEAQVSGYERMARSLLENTLGVRPRTKEFLLAHPLFIVGAYYALKYRSAVYLFIIGVIGQLSIVDTFAHLHTPLDISAIRVIYGIILGIVIGAIYIAAWEMLVRCWNRWTPSLKE